MKNHRFFWVIPILISFGTPVSAWDRHQTLAPWILKGLPSSIKRQFEIPIRVDCAQNALLSQLAHDLDFELTERCKNRLPITAFEILSGAAVDEPDLGLDRRTENLTTGNRRHYYYSGWNFSKPLVTLQNPVRTVGLAPERVETFALKAKSFYRDGKKDLGIRLLAWALHYLQDLAEPYRVAQVPDFRFFNLQDLLVWPPSRAVSDLFLHATQRAQGAQQKFEAEVRQTLLKGTQSPYLECLSTDAKPEDPLLNVSHPRELAFRVAHRSLALSRPLARAGFDSTSPNFELLTCKALQLTGSASRRLILWITEN